MQIKSSLPAVLISFLTEEDLCLLMQNTSISLCIVPRLFIKPDWHTVPNLMLNPWQMSSV